jgi:hypothetical protein
MKRRAFLGTAATAVTAGVAGCSGNPLASGGSCGELDYDIGWESEAILNTNNTPEILFVGTFANRTDNCDVELVVLTIEVLDANNEVLLSTKRTLRQIEPRDEERFIARLRPSDQQFGEVDDYRVVTTFPERSTD